MPLISVIIPAFNSIDTLQYCVDSVFAQSFDDFEMIIVDNGSKDGTLELAKFFAQNHPNVKVLECKKRGVSPARNMGIDAAQGKYLFFLDSDDSIDNHAFETVDSIIEEYFPEMIFVRHLPVIKGVPAKYKDNTASVILEKRQIPAFFLKTMKNYFLHFSTNFFRKDFIEKANARFLENISLGEDILFNLNLFKHAEKIVFLSDPLYLYTADNSNGLNRRLREDFFDIKIRLHLEMIEFFENSNSWNQKNRELYYSVFLNDIFAAITNIYKSNGTKFDIIEILNDPYVLEMCRYDIGKYLPFSKKMFFSAVKNKNLFLIKRAVKMGN